MAHNLGLTGSQIVSERLAAQLAPTLGKAAAKALLTRTSAQAAAEGRPLHEVLAESPQARPLLERGILKELCDPTRYLGAAADLVDAVLQPIRIG